VTNWLLLHGTPLTPAVWDGVAALFPAIGDIACPPVVPGDGPASEVQSTLADELCADTVGVAPPWHVVGHSFGGQVAIELAARKPDLVDRLTLLCTRDSPYPPFATVAATVEREPVAVDASMRRWFSPTELASGGAAVEYARDALLTADVRAWARALAAIAVFDATAATPTIGCPTLVVAAEHDAISDPAAMSAMHRRLWRSRFVVLDGAWHMSVFTEPDRLVDLLSG